MKWFIIAFVLTACVEPRGRGIGSVPTHEYADRTFGATFAEVCDAIGQSCADAGQACTGILAECDVVSPCGLSVNTTLDGWNAEWLACWEDIQTGTDGHCMEMLGLPPAMLCHSATACHS